MDYVKPTKVARVCHTARTHSMLSTRSRLASGATRMGRHPRPRTRRTRTARRPAVASPPRSHDATRKQTRAQHVSSRRSITEKRKHAHGPCSRSARLGRPPPPSWAQSRMPARPVPQRTGADRSLACQDAWTGLIATISLDRHGPEKPREQATYIYSISDSPSCQVKTASVLILCNVHRLGLEYPPTVI